MTASVTPTDRRRIWIRRARGRPSSLGFNHAGYLRNVRGIAELKWCRGMLANGGVEPIEWAPELEPSPEAVEVQV